MESRSSGRATLVVGLLAIAAGAILLLDRFGLVHADSIFRLWPLVLIVIGVVGLFTEDPRRKIVGHGALILVGLLLLLRQLHYLEWPQFWPIVLIGIGVLLVYRALQQQREIPEGGEKSTGPSAIFGTVEKRITCRDFEKGFAQAIFGGVELDFSQADMAGDSAVFDVNIAFGTIEMRIPDNWHVMIETNIVFAGVENVSRPPLPTSSPKKLIVRGDVIFGAIEIKN